MYRIYTKKTGIPIGYVHKIWLIMRLTTVILIATMMQVSASSFAQKISLSKTNAPLKTIIKALKIQSGYGFVYTDNLLEKAKPISINVVNASLKQVLGIILEGTELTYSIDNKTVIIEPKEPSFLDKFKAAFADVTVRGRIVDEQGNPLPQASIQVKGKAKVYNSNDKGEFSIPDVADDAILVIRYVGYKALEISVQGASMPLEIKLNVATGELEEVKITYSDGYQNIPKERATGSFVQIDDELLNRTVSTNILDRIKEVTSSLKIERNVGAVGANRSDITIRGYSTINANQKPLIVLDGFVYEETNDGAVNILNNLNPNDVESITILRDAAAASIWGARSGNGVIVINTKKGKYNQQSNISLISNLRIAEKPRLDKMQLMRPLDVIDIEKKLFASGMYNDYEDVYPGIDYFPVTTPAVEIMLAARKKNLSNPNYNVLNDPEVLTKLTTLGEHDVRNDISRYLLQPEVNQQYALSLSGGTDKIKYYGSLGYDKNLPSEKENKYDRLTLRFENTYRPIKNLELNTYLVYTKSKSINNGLGYSSYLPGVSSAVAPYTSFADPSGNPLHVSLKNSSYRETYIDTAQYPALLDWHYRPLDEIHNNDNTNNSYDTRFGGFIKYTITPNLSVSIKSQYLKELSDNNNYYSTENYATRSLINQYMSIDATGKINYPIPFGGMLALTNAERTTWDVRTTLSFNKSWNKHQINAIGVIEASESKYSAFDSFNLGYDPKTATIASKLDYVTSFPVRASGGSIFPIPGGDNSLRGNLNRFTGYGINASYTLSNKYLFTASARVDASNFFGSKANQRRAPVWSSGLLWNISKENFYNVKWLSDLKLKVTYGYNANMNNKATALPTAQYSGASTGIYHKMPFGTLLSAPNPGLTWEKIRMINIGVEYAILNQRISGSFEYYTKSGINLIGPITTEATKGIVTYTGNYGNMRSKGFDLTLNSLNIDRAIKWRSALNLSHNQDKITNYEIPDVLKNNPAAYFGGTAIVVGKPLYRMYSYRDAGLDPLNGNPRGYINGEVKPFSEVLQNGKPEDLIYHGSRSPNLFGSLLNQFDYKSISFSFNISFSLDYYIRKKSVAYQSLDGFVSGHSDYSLRWQKSGDEMITSVPSFPNSYDGRDAFYLNSSNLVMRGDHFRLIDVRLSYHLSKANLKRAPFSYAVLFLNANNLGVLWRANKEGIDPNYPDTMLPPISRNIALGVTLNFK
jgi:TonB-linked SusC/RagA family outer membrane protein